MKNPRTAWLVYSVLRLLFFAVPFAVLFALGIWPWLAAIFAALIGFSLSIIFLSRPRDTASESIYEWRNRDRTPDSILEDEAVEASEAQQAASDATAEPQATAAPEASAEPQAAAGSGDESPHARDTRDTQ
ncbi:DUF4229 domain-containing protein [Leucobacter luti]|uniref:DUF4229 domain-containing protein n=1 Tax=Leucobacter luti TaxID=340320 RepID=UPI001F545194|nr:DUF4229 domain-containing protein [Leucobacter luti]